MAQASSKYTQLHHTHTHTPVNTWFHIVGLKGVVDGVHIRENERWSEGII